MNLSIGQMLALLDAGQYIQTGAPVALSTESKVTETVDVEEELRQLFNGNAPVEVLEEEQENVDDFLNYFADSFNGILNIVSFEESGLYEVVKNSEMKRALSDDHCHFDIVIGTVHGNLVLRAHNNEEAESFVVCPVVIPKTLRTNWSVFWNNKGPNEEKELSEEEFRDILENVFNMSAVLKRVN